MPTCKGCGQEIIWKKTEDGKNMPLDINPKKKAIILKDGATVVIRDTYTVHWETCPKADNFRKHKEG